MLTKFGKLRYDNDPSKIAGRGKYGTVFKGLITSDTEFPVAVKRIQKIDVTDYDSFLREV